MIAREVLGRDLEPGESGMIAVAVAIEQNGMEIVGTCACVPRENTWKARCFCGIRNFLFRMGLIKGSNGILFINSKLFKKIGGYDESKKTFEHINLIKRALAHEAKWIYLRDVYVRISMRRYENNGYFKTLFWWMFEAIRYKLGLQSREWIPASHLENRK
jgi:hypothetical protein